MLKVYKTENEENKKMIFNQSEKLNQVNNELKEKNSKLIDQRNKIDW